MKLNRNAFSILVLMTANAAFAQAEGSEWMGNPVRDEKFGHIMGMACATKEADKCVEFQIKKYLYGRSDSSTTVGEPFAIQKTESLIQLGHSKKVLRAMIALFQESYSDAAAVELSSFNFTELEKQIRNHFRKAPDPTDLFIQPGFYDPISAAIGETVIEFAANSKGGLSARTITKTYGTSTWDDVVFKSGVRAEFESIKRTYALERNSVDRCLQVFTVYYSGADTVPVTATVCPREGK